MPEGKSWLSLKVQVKQGPGDNVQKASFLISIPKKIVRLATQRNRIKRLIREAFRQEDGLDPVKAYLFKVLQNPGGLGLKEVQEVMDRLIGQTSE